MILSLRILPRFSIAILTFSLSADNLRAKYFSYGLLVPSLPPKRLVVGGGDKEFLTERMQVDPSLLPCTCHPHATHAKSCMSFRA